jgi:hypothetical protein
MQRTGGVAGLPGRESRFNIVFSVYEFARHIFYDINLEERRVGKALVMTEQGWPERPNERKYEWQPRRRKTSRTRS